MVSSFWGGFVCKRNALIVLNVLYIIFAFILIGTSTYARTHAVLIDYKIAGGIIACGAFLLIIALVGLLGTGLHHQVILFIYMIALILLFVIQFSVACACLALNKNQLQSVFVLSWNSSDLSEKSQLQDNFKCCGATKDSQNELYYGNETGIVHPPCVNFTHCDALVNDTMKCCTGDPTDSSVCMLNSCWDELEEFLVHAIRVVGICGLIFSFTELIGTWLAYRYRNLKNPNVNPNAFL